VKFRVVQTKSDYQIEYRYRYWPFWFVYKVHCGYEFYTPASFITKELAVAFIDDWREKENRRALDEELQRHRVVVWKEVK
jgi:hypothetical protein